MIPRSIKLKGFLCYRDEQQIDFDGGNTLWMLGGLNGSGKSAIFDAVTFVLFGCHRGGATGHDGLINKEADGLLVEFDFLLDGELIRARRTLRRKTGGGSGRATYQIARFADGKPVPIEGTNQKTGFDEWMDNNIGLDYTTFTSSVLLLQGKADKLLDAAPSGRRAVLAGIVNLARYERLHSLADERRKKLENDAKTLAQRLSLMPVVEPLEFAVADENIRAAEEVRESARLEVERVQGFDFQARSWRELQDRLQAARDRCRKAEGLLAEAPAIEKAMVRLSELREVLPHIQIIVEQGVAGHTAEERIKELVKVQQKKKDELAARDNVLKQTRDKKATLQNLIAQDETRHRQVVTALLESKARLGKLEEYERHEADLQRFQQEMARLPADPAAAAGKTHAALDAVEAVARAVPLLARFQSHREDLQKAQTQAEEAGHSLVQVEEHGKRCLAENDALKPKLEEAARVLQEATDRVTETRTVLQQARESLGELSQLDGAKVCRHCGQNLTEGHLHEEKRRRGVAVAEAEAKAKQAALHQQSARTNRDAFHKEAERAAEALTTARNDYRDADNRRKQARETITRLQLECARDYAELPEHYRQQVSPSPAAEWSTTAYPTSEAVQALRSEAAGVPAARTAHTEAEQVLQQWHRLKTQEAASLQSLGRLKADLPGDPQAVRADHARLDGDDRSLQKSLEVNRAQARGVDHEIEQLGREREQSLEQARKIESDIRNQELSKQHARQNVEQRQRLLPSAWQAPAAGAGMRDYQEWHAERASLERDGTEDKARQLDQARLKLDDLRRDLGILEEQDGSYPAEARQDLAVLKSLLVDARKRDKECEEALVKVRQERERLENNRKQREQLDCEYLAKAKESETQSMLAQLLGREHLQLFLVRQAEREVVHYANAVLDRLSGGQLYLRLSGEGDSAKALELEAYNRVTGEQPISVAFLSGSQKFRVAVSLALGIGQYASRQHRPIESVIIDEGFGCLDRHGRQVMIQELQNLRGQMRCILLVSHQEEFAEAFADGYHFELEGGATRVRRFQK